VIQKAPKKTSNPYKRQRK